MASSTRYLCESLNKFCDAAIKFLNAFIGMLDKLCYMLWVANGFTFAPCRISYDKMERITWQKKSGE